MFAPKVANAQRPRATRQPLPARRPSPSGKGAFSQLRRLNYLETDEPKFDIRYLDQTTAPDAGAGQAAAGSATVPHGAAVPTNLRQIHTSWTGGADKYGFQVKLECSSRSGSVADLQARAPSLVFREYVRLARNDFALRISPEDPTIAPEGGVSFAPASTSILGPNLLEFNRARDTHWMPKWAVRYEDYALVRAAPHPLPAILQSVQVYQYSTDGWPGSSWTTFAGPFTITHALQEAVRGDRSSLRFTTEKPGVYAVSEAYKP